MSSSAWCPWTWPDATLRRFGQALCAVSIAAGPIGMVLLTVAGRLDQSLANFNATNCLMASLYGLLGLLLLRSEVRNLATWLIVVAAVTSAFPAVLGGWWELLASGQGVDADALSDANWPAGASTALALGYHLWPFGNYGAITLGLLLIPDGRLLSRRWAPVAGLSIVAMVAVWLRMAAAFPMRDSSTVAETDPLVAIGDGATFVVLAPLSFVSLLLRYRRADQGLRRRLRWVLYGGSLIVLMVTAIVVVPALRHPGFTLALYPVLAVALGMAIWRDQLFDIDRLIGRTLLYGALATFIAAVYIGVVFGVGSLLGVTADSRSVLSLMATVIVALLFQSVRRRLERVANRLVYGRRATPYEVLSDLSAQLTKAESTDGLLDRMTTLVAAATGAEQAVIWRRDGETPNNGEILAVWPQPAGPTGFTLDGETSDRFDAPIERAGQELGVLTVIKGRGDALSPTERRLVEDLAGSAGLVLERAQLDAELAARADALVEARRRLLDVQAGERRRLERQLDEQTHRHLTTLADALDDGARRATRTGAERAAERDATAIGAQLDALAEEVRTAGAEITALAQGMYPPVLESAGLTAAVESLAAGVPVDVTVDSNLQESSPGDEATEEVELAVYFTVAEALTNVAKHAEADSVTVRLDRSGDTLHFEVVDDGQGFDLDRADGSSTGLAGLRDRVESVGGTVSVRSTPGQGTTVAGVVPVAGSRLVAPISV